MQEIENPTSFPHVVKLSSKELKVKAERIWLVAVH